MGHREQAWGRASRSRLVRFAAVGASGVGVNLGALWLLSDVLGVRDVPSSTAAIEASIVWNFVLNSVFTYRDRNANASAGLAARFVRYNVVSLVGLVIQLGAFLTVRAIAVHGFGRVALGGVKYAAQLLGIALATAWNFAGHLHFTWRQAPARSAGDAAAPEVLPAPEPEAAR